MSVMADGGPRVRLRAVAVDVRGRPLRARALTAWLARVAPAGARGAVSIALVSDADMRALNRQYRHKDYATDVLSFPSVPVGRTGRNGGTGRTGPGRGSASASLPAVPPLPPVQPIRAVQPFLGDIVIARGVARRQARAARHSELTELRVLALHGLLHLLGYDHGADGGRMRRVERRLRRKGGLREGLIERAAAAPPRRRVPPA